MDYIVRYSEVDSYGYVTPLNMIKFLNDTGQEHMDDIRQSPGFIGSPKETWVISQSFMEVYNYPRCKDLIRVETWISSVAGRHAFREAQCYSDRGELLAASRLLGTLIDRATGKPKRVALGAKEVAAWGVKPQKASKYEFSSFNIEVFTPTWQKDLDVHYQHIDYNSHANNAHYLSWFLEAIPAEFHQHNQLKSIEIIYRHELKCKDIFTVSVSQLDTSTGQLVLLGEIVHGLGNRIASMRGSFTGRCK